MQTWWIRTTLFASLMAGAVTVGLTCVDYEEEDAYLFMQEASGVRSGLEPFFYSTHMFYGGETEPYYREADLVADWRRYVHGEVPDGDIYAFLAKLEPLRFFAAIDRDRLAPSVEPVAEAGLWQWAVEKKDQPLQDYLIFCKEVEQAFEVEKDGWTMRLNDVSGDFGFDYTNVDMEGNPPVYPGTRSALPRLDAQAQKALKGTLSPFLRERYLFQRMLLNYYQNKCKEVIGLYEANFKASGSPRQIYQWAKFFAALSEQKAGNKALADLYLAEVFLHSPAKRLASLQNFEGGHKAMTLAKTTDQKAALLVIEAAGQIDYAEAPLRRVMDVAGPADGLALLVAREISKIETQNSGLLHYPSATERDPDRKVREHDWAHARYLEALCREAAGKAAPAYRPGFRLMQAHLMLLQQNRACEPLLAQVLADPYADSLQKTQARVDQLLIIAIGTGPLEVRERAILADNLALGGGSTLVENVTNALLVRGDTMAGRLVGYLSTISALGPDRLVNDSEEEPEEASPKKERTEDEKRWQYYNFTFAGRNSLPTDPWAFFQYVKGHPQDPLCSRILAKAPMLETWARDWQGGYLAFTGRLEEAEAMLKPLPDEYEDMFRTEYFLDEDPTQLTYFHNHGAHLLPREKRYTKLGYVQKMLELKRKAEGSRGDEAARAWLTLGHMAYNMSYNGNAWSMISNYWTGTGPSISGPLAGLLEEEFASGENAAPYYEKAMAMAQNEKLGAVAALMLGRINIGSGSAVAEGWEYNQAEVDTAFADLYHRYPKLAPELISNCEAMGQFVR